MFSVQLAGKSLNAMQVRRVDILNDVTMMQKFARRAHEEVLELITAMSDDTSSVGRLLSCVQVLIPFNR
jgi:hypothetical protein